MTQIWCLKFLDQINTQRKSWKKNLEKKFEKMKKKIKKKFEIFFWFFFLFFLSVESPAPGKENVWFLDSQDFENLSDFWTGCNVRKSPNNWFKISRAYCPKIYTVFFLQGGAKTFLNLLSQRLSNRHIPWQTMSRRPKFCINQSKAFEIVCLKLLRM